ncbi:flagellar protein FlaG [Bacillus sp. FJAT-45350]|uniref:flagellar protein FlaG n=1 Tax=Bacillus sp. FJAT-45350 TaxID=2011014 RepID=UPI000BB8FD9C|nr:flagellar protein FlaG [Bacillus sp. FJAT-45350]
MEIKSLVGSGGGTYSSKSNPKAENTSLDRKEIEQFRDTMSVTEKINEHARKNKAKISREELDKQVEGMNKFLESNLTSLKFNIHEKLDRIYVQVVDKETDDVVREVPPEQFLDMVAAMLQHVGLIIDERV